MGAYLFDNFSTFKNTLAEASEAISLDIKKLIYEGTEADLALTANTQPALLSVSVGTFRVLKENAQLKIEAAAGHSIGEYAALVTAGVMDFSTAMKAVRLRGEAMQSAVPVGEGGMVAVLGLEPDQVTWLCEWAEKESGFKPLSPANFNSPGQIVISGSMKCIDWLKTNFKAELIPGSPKRAKLIPLNVSAPFHCAMMKPAQEKMDQFLNGVTFNKPQFPIIQNFTAGLVENPTELKQNLIHQVSAPVLWTQTMKLMETKSWMTGIECGHGSVIKGLFKKMDNPNFKILSSQTQEDLDLIKTQN
ncbi:MAG: ACP S-malonyltransferase [Bdellovibrionaceae bacterium]|nr:ACP S-malonyltransferase [Pseudobdellovibrionaceae bacterium]